MGPKMPVSLVCESDVSSALHNSLSSSISHSSITSSSQSEQSLQNQLAASSKRVLLTKIDYEEVPNFTNSVHDTLKSKYIILNSSAATTTNINGKVTCNGAVAGPADKSHNNNSLDSSTHDRKDATLPTPKCILYPREEVLIGWKSSGRKWQIGAGMINVGNTCYLNSTLQALFHVPAFANWLMADTKHRDRCEEKSGVQGGCIICSMAKTLLASQTNQSSAIKPYLVYSKLRLVCKHLVPGQQEDAHEFLRYLMEAMEKAYLQRYPNHLQFDQFSKETTPINQILGGYLKTSVRCLDCQHVSVTFQHFEDILLDIRKANTVEEALDLYFARERLEDMGYKCESCKKKVSATKQFSLERAPISLCIQLKRFSIVGNKLNKHITIRQNLNLSKYSSRKHSSEPLSYRLVSMVTHLGASQHCGHYTAIGLTDAGSYYQFDDSSVRSTSVQNVLNTNAYIMFYELETTTNKLTGQGNAVHQSLNQRNSTFVENGIKNESSTNGSSCNGSSMPKAPFIGPLLPPKVNGVSENGHTTNGTSTIGYSSTITTTASSSSSSNTTGKLSNGITKPLGSKLVNSNSSPFKRTSGDQQNSVSIKLSNPAVNRSNGTVVPVPATSTTKPLSNGHHATNEDDNEDDDDEPTIDSTTKKEPTLPSMPNLGADLATANDKPINGNIKTKIQNSVPQSKVTSTKYSSLMNGDDSSDEDDDSNESNQKASATNGHAKTTNQHSKHKGSSTTPATVATIAVVAVTSPTVITASTASTSNAPAKQNGVISSATTSASSSADSSPLRSGSISPVIERSAQETLRPKSPRPNLIKRLVPYTSDDDSEYESSGESSQPVLVKTKAGPFQVTNTNTTPPRNGGFSRSASADNIKTAASANGKVEEPSAVGTTRVATPFVTGNTSTSLKRHYSYNGDSTEKNETTAKLLKHSHMGYGASVASWNGKASNLEKEVNEDKQEELKRQTLDFNDAEMDRGHKKKTKQHQNLGRDNPGYNPFQEAQNQRNPWIVSNGNGQGQSNGTNGSTSSTNGPRPFATQVYRQNPHRHRHHRSLSANGSGGGGGGVGNANANNRHFNSNFRNFKRRFTSN